MSETSPAVPVVTPGHWAVTYCIGATALACALTTVFSLALLYSTANPWSKMLDTLSFSAAILLVSLVLIAVLAALPCLLFFWLAQRFAWNQWWIYLMSGALAAQFTMPVMTTLLPELFNLPYGVNSLLHYLQLALMFGACGVFLGGLFWWRSGRHLR